MLNPAQSGDTVENDRNRLMLGTILSSVNLGSMPSSSTPKQFEIPSDLYNNYGVYILAIGSAYAVGSVSIMRVSGMGGAITINPLITSSYFTIASVDASHFSITASSGATDVVLTRIA